MSSPSWPPPGLWYLAAAPSAPPTPALAYVSPVPVLPYPSATVFFASPGPTSARPASEWHSSSSARPARGPRHSVQLDLEDLEALHQALSRAVGAAERVRSRSRQLSRALEAELRQAPSLRGSCPL